MRTSNWVPMVGTKPLTRLILSAPLRLAELVIELVELGAGLCAADGDVEGAY